MTKPITQRLSTFQCLAALGLSLVLNSFCSAQQVDLQIRIDAASNSLEQLDTQAGTCLSALNQGTEDIAQQSCSEFLASIDGELLAGYLEHCQSLKSWRDEFVAATVGSDAAARDSEENLQLLVGIEYSCGEGALQKRTEFVTSAFSLLQDRQMQNQGANALLSRRLTELQMESTLNNERRLLQNSVLRQGSRRELETERQMNDLEKELIRQQINKPDF